MTLLLKILKLHDWIQLFGATKRRKVSNVIEELSFNIKGFFVRVFFVDVILKGQVQRVFVAAVDAVLEKWKKVEPVGFFGIEYGC